MDKLKETNKEQRQGETKKSLEEGGAFCKANGKKMPRPKPYGGSRDLS